MCEVLAFKPSELRSRREGSGPGEVVIFPGVRVERREFTREEEIRLSHLPRKTRARSRRHPLAASPKRKD